MGFVLGSPIDKVFREGKLPEGWTLKYEGDGYYSAIVDTKGNRRGLLFEKHAGYDTKASFFTIRRFNIEKNLDLPGRIQMQVLDKMTGMVVLRSEIVADPCYDMDGIVRSKLGPDAWDERRDIESTLMQTCAAWLRRTVGDDWANPARHWS